MTLTEQEIDRIVREVIRRLVAVGVSVVPTKTTLELDDRLVTLATLNGRLDGIEQLVVPPKAVVTPAVRDALRDKNVALVRRNPS